MKRAALSILGLFASMSAIGCGGESGPTAQAMAKPDASVKYGPTGDGNARDAGAAPDAMAHPDPDNGMPDASAPLCVRLLPIGAHDESSDTRHACHTTSTLAEDGEVAGLDYADDVDTGRIDGQSVAGCLRVDFAQPKPLDSVTIVARTAEDACDAGKHCSSSYCGQGATAAIFYGMERDHYTYAGRIEIASSRFIEYRLPMAQHAVNIVVCRLASNGVNHDDIEVDSVTACTH